MGVSAFVGEPRQPRTRRGFHSLFSWAKFLAKERAQPQGRNGKPKPSSLSLFEWALDVDQQRVKEPVGAGH